MNILATVQAYNAYDLTNIFDYWKENCQDTLVYNLVDWPSDMSIDILPSSERNNIANELELKANMLSDSSRSQSRIDAVINRLRRNDVKNIDELRYTWAKRTKKYDQIRKNDISMVNIKLKEYMEEWLKIKR